MHALIAALELYDPLLANFVNNPAMLSIVRSRMAKHDLPNAVGLNWMADQHRLQVIL